MDRDVELPADQRRRLREVLAELYPDGARASVVASEAGVPMQLVDFSGAAGVVWFNVLLEAEKHPGLTKSIVVRARSDYPTRDDLLRWLDLLDPERREQRPRVVRAGTVPLEARQALVFRLVKKRCSVDDAAACAAANGLTLPSAMPDAAACWTWLVQQIHLRDLDLGPLYKAADLAPPSPP